MTVFTDASGNDLNNFDINEAAIMVKVRDESRIDELPTNYRVVGADDLDFRASNADGSINSTGYFHAGYTSPGGEAVTILSDDGRIFVSFAGTNDNLDYYAIFQFRNDSYIDGFEAYLESVARFAEKNGYEIDLVTGKSLGGAATNMLRDRPDIAGGAYADANYFAVASPLIADSTENIINFGYDNDFAFEAYETYFGKGERDHASATDNLIYFNSNYADSNWSQFNEMSAHSYANFERGITALSTTVFADEMSQDSFVVLGGTPVVDMNVALNRNGFNGTDAYFLATNNTSYTITGTSLNDHIQTGTRDDVINSGAGNDVIYGGKGSDIIDSGAGNDIVYGENGVDIVTLGTGNDIFYDDDQWGNWGKDTVYAGDGDDIINGGGGDDTFYGDNGYDTIYGGEGDDYIDGGSHYDTIYGGNGNDTVVGGNGKDTIYLDGGNDVFIDNVQSDKHGADTVYGGDGDDTLNGAGGKDTLYGDNGNDTIYGGSQDDLIHGGEGDDYIDGGSHYDTIYGGNGNDTVVGGNGKDTIYLDGGNDVFIDNVQSDKHGADTVYGGDGDDVLTGLGGNDVLNGGNDDDLLSGGQGSNTLTGGTGNDTFVFDGSGRDNVTDFDVNTDQCDFNGSFDNWTSSDFIANASMIGGDTIVTLSNSSSITFVDMSSNDWDNIQFV